MNGWARRFDAFSARKSAEAAAAAMTPLTTTVERPDEGLERIGNSWSRALFDGPFYLSPAPSPELPAASLVFVQSRDGNTVSANPSKLGGGAIDLHLVYEGLSRVAADAVLAGAGTVRGGQLVFSTWHPELVALRTALGLPRHPVQMVASLRGLPIDEALLFNVPDLRVILITVASVLDTMAGALRARPWIEPIVMESAADLPDVFRRVRRSGVRRISCVGGRTLARALIDVNLIQDLFLTTGKNNGGEPATPLYPRALPGDVVVRKVGTGPDTGVVFEHIKLA